MRPADMMPMDLNLNLWENRRSVGLPDSQGDIWMMLVARSEHHEGLQSNVPDGSVIRLAVVLPAWQTSLVKRFSTLFRHQKWCPFVTDWCRTGYGRQTFSVSTWETIASLRMDKVCGHITVISRSDLMACS